MFQILVHETDKLMRETYCNALEDGGYTAKPAANVSAALNIIEHSVIDLIISGLNLPNNSGIELVKTLRDSGNTCPMIVISSSDLLADKEKAFTAGVDDYMVRPVHLSELIWRVEAILRRCQLVNSRRTSIGSALFDCDALTVSTNGKTVELPQKEFYLLYKLITSPNRIFTRRQIMDDIWGIDSETDLHTLEVHVSRLREKFYNNPDFEIVTVRGVGYKAVLRSENKA